MTTRDGAPTRWFEAMIDVETDECQLWPFSTNGRYGVLRPSHCERYYVHQVACELEHGPCPVPGWTASHTCGHPLCVNRRHLVWESLADNAARQIGHGTALRGERNPGAKLREADVVAIRARAAAGTMQRALAAEYGVAETTLSDIVRRRIWAWL